MTFLIMEVKISNKNDLHMSFRKICAFPGYCHFKSAEGVSAIAEPFLCWAQETVHSSGSPYCPSPLSNSSSPKIECGNQVILLNP